MVKKKGQIPAHIKPKVFNHPKPDHPFIVILQDVEDPRSPSCNFRHSIVTILFVTLVGVLCGAKDWEEIHQCTIGMSDWIDTYVDAKEGMPSVKTLKRVLSLIPTERLQVLLTELGQTLREAKDTQSSDIISIDGKTLRGSRGWGEEGGALHLLHAWSNDNRLCLGQISVDEKSNEIKAVPKLLEMLEIRGAIITTDALNTQRAVAKAVIDKGADYVLPVKENHRGLLEDIEFLFKDADRINFCGLDGAQREDLEKNGGRTEIRSYALLDAEDLPQKGDWAGCLSIGRVIRQRTKGEKTSTETCYYITSLGLDIKQFSDAVRNHWGIENGLHWCLDVIFNEDNHRFQDKVGAANLSLMRKTALGILTQDKTLKCGRSAKQMRAATSAAYRDHLLKNCF